MLELDSAGLDVDQEDGVSVHMDLLVGDNQVSLIFLLIVFGEEAVERCIVDF